tara:strand:- start:369 stop:524 length:156 start_codon:yes stop_codon:yes gene_type:complete
MLDRKEKIWCVGCNYFVKKWSLEKHEKTKSHIRRYEKYKWDKIFSKKEKNT